MRRRKESSTGTPGTRLAATTIPRRAAAPTIVGTYIVGGQTAITAAAQRLNGSPDTAETKRPPPQKWQAEAWELRSEIGELRFIGERTARALSRVTIFIGDTNDTDEEPTPTEDTQLAALSVDMFGLTSAIQQSLHRAAQHLIYAGESLFLITEVDSTDPDGAGLTFTPYSPSEITGKPGEWKLNDGANTRDIGNDELLVRCWIPSPDRLQIPESAAMAVLPVARELRALTQHVSAQVDSRLAGAGILIIPESARTPGYGTTTGDNAQTDPFINDLVESMIVPIGDRASAAAVVPLPVFVPDDVVGKVQHLTFSTPLDAEAKNLRDEAIRRLALGMDSSPEALQGMSTSNHWGAWSIEESEVSLVVAPLAATICHALTTGWLQPLLEEMGIDPKTKQVWYDTSPLQIRPDRSKDAQALHGAGVLGVEATLRENGFADTDAPTADERRERILLQLLTTRTDLTDQILATLGVDFTTTAPVAADPLTAEPPAEPGPVIAPDPASQSNPIPEEPML